MGLGPSSEATITTKPALRNSLGSDFTRVFKRGKHSNEPESIPFQSQRIHSSPPSVVLHAAETPPDIIFDIHDNKQRETIFTWKYGGHQVHLAGDFNEWKEKIPMVPSSHDFYCSQRLPPGKYLYRFEVDGQWQVDPTIPTETSDEGIVYNVVELTPWDYDQSVEKPIDSSLTPPGSYTQMYNAVEVDTGDDDSDDGDDGNGDRRYEPGLEGRTPPTLPPHLQRALLNASQVSGDPQLLPLPHHVMLNHLYVIPKQEDNAMIVGITQRYKEKYVTTVYYKSLDSINSINLNNTNTNNVRRTN